MTAGIDLLRRAERNGAGLVVDGEPLTCELIKLHAERAFGEHGAAAEEFIASHGAQTAVGPRHGLGARSSRATSSSSTSSRATASRRASPT